mgnify:CR=1 FL=1
MKKQDTQIIHKMLQQGKTSTEISLILGILCLRRKWGRGRAITAVILSSLGLAITLELIGAFWLRGLF